MRDIVFYPHSMHYRDILESTTAAEVVMPGVCATRITELPLKKTNPADSRCVAPFFVTRQRSASFNTRFPSKSTDTSFPVMTVWSSSVTSTRQWYSCNNEPSEDDEEAWFAGCSAARDICFFFFYLLKTPRFFLVKKESLQIEKQKRLSEILGDAALPQSQKRGRILQM